MGNPLNVSTHEFSTFEKAKELASSFSLAFNVEVGIKRSGERFAVHIPNSIPIASVRSFAKTLNLFGMDPRTNFQFWLLAYVNRAQFSSHKLAWRDPDTGLAWDATRLIYHEWHTEHPPQVSDIMDALEYAGLRNWRLPTLDELRTLNIPKLDAAGVKYTFRGEEVSFWSCEDSLYTGPEKSFIDFVSMGTGHQRFIEHDRNRSTSADGYTESAQTMMVTADRWASED